MEKLNANDLRQMDYFLADYENNRNNSKNNQLLAGQLRDKIAKVLKTLKIKI